MCTLLQYVFLFFGGGGGRVRLATCIYIAVNYIFIMKPQVLMVCQLYHRTCTQYTYNNESFYRSLHTCIPQIAGITLICLGRQWDGCPLQYYTLYIFHCTHTYIHVLTVT